MQISLQFSCLQPQLGIITFLLSYMSKSDLRSQFGESFVSDKLSFTVFSFTSIIEGFAAKLILAFREIDGLSTENKTFSRKK